MCLPADADATNTNEQSRRGENFNVIDLCFFNFFFVVGVVSDGAVRRRAYAIGGRID